jgi:hypothetical protein
MCSVHTQSNKESALKMWWKKVSILKVRATYSSETSADFDRLHGAMSQKPEFFIITAGRISSPA